MVTSERAESYLKDAYEKFNQGNLSIEIGLNSKFAAVRPKQCVLAGGSGTHSECVYTVKQSLKKTHIPVPCCTTRQTLLPQPFG